MLFVFITGNCLPHIVLVRKQVLSLILNIKFTVLRLAFNRFSFWMYRYLAPFRLLPQSVDVSCSLYCKQYGPGSDCSPRNIASMK